MLPATWLVQPPLSGRPSQGSHWIYLFQVLPDPTGTVFTPPLQPFSLPYSC